jgi:hypothetical protein
LGFSEIMMNEAAIRQEWERVKHLPSLYKHYANHTEYMKWRQRFTRMNYIRKGPGGWQKKTSATAIPKKTIDKAKYTREWRKRNPGKAKEHVQRYWMKRLQAANE